MNFNVYLPEDLGQQAKDEELKLSRLLREAVMNELHRRTTMRETLEEPQVYEIEIGDDVFVNGETVEERGTYLGRITGKLVHDSPIWQVFLTADKRVIVYNDDGLTYYVLEAGATERELIEFLRKHLDVDFEFAQACRALGVRPVIDL